MNFTAACAHIHMHTEDSSSLATYTDNPVYSCCHLDFPTHAQVEKRVALQNKSTDRVIIALTTHLLTYKKASSPLLCFSQLNFSSIHLDPSFLHPCLLPNKECTCNQGFCLMASVLLHPYPNLVILMLGHLSLTSYHQYGHLGAPPPEGSNTTHNYL